MTRYIDADKLTKAIECTYLDGDSSYSYHATGEGDTLIGKFQVLDIISDQPTADVKEAKYGEWILEREPDGTPYCYHCSVCDNDFHHIGITTASRFCPNCGAELNCTVREAHNEIN